MGTCRKSERLIEHDERYLSRRSHEDRISRHFPVISTSAPNHELRIRRSHAEVTSRPENAVLHNKSKPRPRTHHYLTDNLHQEPEVSRPRPRSFYETPSIVRELRGPRNVIDPRSIMVRSPILNWDHTQTTVHINL